MSRSVEALASEVRALLIRSGFPEEHFFIKIESQKVKVLFDMKEAVDYFKGDFDYSDLSDDHIFRYQKDGKRHCAIIL